MANDTCINGCNKLTKVEGELGVYTEKLQNNTKEHERMGADISIMKNDIQDLKSNYTLLNANITSLREVMATLEATIKRLSEESKGKVSPWTAFVTYTVPSSILITLVTMIATGKLKFM